MPNAYAIPKNVGDITLADIESLFPLGMGESGNDFHFRFKYKYNNQAVWLDLNNKQCKVPKFDNKIIMKVTRKNDKDCIDLLYFDESFYSKRRKLVTIQIIS